jgi:hypothetical protein
VETFVAQEAELAEEWRIRIRRNVQELLASMSSFVVVEHLSEVFAGVLGEAREKHLRAALKELHDEKVTLSDSKGKLYPKSIIRQPAV